jgi:hypothetical protein
VSALRRLARGAAFATLVFVVLLGARPVAVETIVAGYALALAALALAAITGSITAARRHEPSRFEAELRRARLPPARPPELVRMERELTLGESSAGQFHRRLRPLLHEIADARSRDPQQAVSAETWALIAPDVPAPADRSARGVPLRRIRAVLDELERL